MTSETILVAYGEIALKSRFVRSHLEKTLADHIRLVLLRNGYNGFRVLRRYGRLYVEGVSSNAANVIAKIFGVVSSMPALRTTSDYNSILNLTVEVASENLNYGQSFAVRPKTVGKHPYTSRDLAKNIGSAILTSLGSRNVKVNLDDPEVTIYVEVRDKDAFVYTQILKGVGGLPYGSQGRLVSLFSGGIDSPVATWMMMKRGADVIPLFMDQSPFVGEQYVERGKKVFQVLKSYVPLEKFKLYIAPFTKVMEYIIDSPNPSLRCILCKRAMYRVASLFSAENDIQGIITGESLGQVASQTLHNLAVIDESVRVPIYRPLIGCDKVEIEETARKIKTYAISSKMVEGCSAVPEKPATRSNLVEIVKLERELGIFELCAEVAREIQALDNG